MINSTRLKDARLAKGLTQQQLAERSGVKQGTISKIERGDQETSTFTVQLAQALGVPAESLGTDANTEDRNIVGEPQANYNPAPKELLSDWGDLDEDDKQEIARMAKRLAQKNRQRR